MPRYSIIELACKNMKEINTSYNKKISVMKLKIESPKYINNELTKRRPDTIFVSTMEELISIAIFEEADGNRTFRTSSCCKCETATTSALIVSFGISCVIDRIVIVCPECAKKMTKKQKKLLDRYQITND